MDNIVRKGDIACNNHYLLSLQCFLPYLTLIFHFKCALILSQKTNFRLFQIEKVCRRQFFNFAENGRKFLKRVEKLWEKEKLLVKSNFSIFHIVFYLFQKLPTIFIKFEIVVYKLFQFGRV